MLLLLTTTSRTLRPASIGIHRIFAHPRVNQLFRRYYSLDSESTSDSKDVDTKSLKVPASARFNELGIQQLSDQLHSQVFLKPPTPPDPELVALAKDHLSRHDLLGRTQDGTEPVAFDLPPLQGKSIDEHFYRLGMDASEPYLSLAQKYAHMDLPPRPRKWERQSGWMKYNADGTAGVVDAPNEELLTFDTEVMYKVHPFAVMACAASPSAWYAWLSPWLLGESAQTKHLVPLGSPSQSRIVVGHNVGYDRARVLEEYDINQSRNFFMDTMSLHVATNGMCSQQRPTWMKHKKNSDLRARMTRDSESVELASLLENKILSEEEEELWVGRSSINSLRDVAKFHCNITIDKAQREYFAELDKNEIVARYEELLDYCAADVAITHKVYRKVIPNFLQVCPHPVTFGALRHLSSVILPVNEQWEQYLERAERTYHERLQNVQDRLVDLCQDALALKDQPESYERDPWLRQLDWSGQEVKMVKGKKKGDPPRPAARQKLPGMPKWYKDLFPSSKAGINLTVRTRVTPLLLKLAYCGYPLVWTDKYGWAFQVPNSEIQRFKQQAVVQCDMSAETAPSLRDDKAHAYFKIPHKDGPAARCTSPLSKGYLQFFDSGQLSSEFALAKEALEMNASCSYWISARDRILNQLAVFDESKTSHTGSKQGFILPQVIPMGTITRRAVENTWLTASNAKSSRVGSELKAMIQTPPGYVFVGADVDSEELWIAGLVGDAQFRLHGGNALGFMNLEGSKSAGTDLHSKTAKILGISRNDAKVFNYGRIYGAGLNFAATLLRQFNPSLSEEDTKSIADKLYRETKGARTKSKVFSDSPFYRGGSESFVFNKLEEFADQERPRTPVLGAGITEALMRRFINRGSFLTSRINWAIQSSGVDYLHLLIVAMDYLTRRYNLSARLAISVHDEIRYLTRAEDQFRVALALQVANLWTRAMFAQQMGIEDLPQACAFFSAVDIDSVLRKEVDLDCVTPSHPTAIPPGKSLDIGQLLAHGSAACLNPAVEPAMAPEKYTYTPRPTVMSGLMDSHNTAFIRAQITADEKEFRSLVRDLFGAKTRPSHPSQPSQPGQAPSPPTPAKSKPKTVVATASPPQCQPSNNSYSQSPSQSQSQSQPHAVLMDRQPLLISDMLETAAVMTTVPTATTPPRIPQTRSSWRRTWTGHRVVVKRPTTRA